jgi:hypothetical protein
LAFLPQTRALFQHGFRPAPPEYSFRRHACRKPGQRLPRYLSNEGEMEEASTALLSLVRSFIDEEGAAEAETS